MGDPQPRKRKEKRKKKDGSSSERSKAEAELLARKLSTAPDDSDEGPAPTKPQVQKDSYFNEGDSVIHVDHDHGTGGHWCAKIIFFALLAVLIGLIGLIIIENRGLTDLDTPVGESRYAQVFDGWVEEGPIHDDHHDEHTLDLKHPEEEHDEHDEGFDEEHEDEIEDIESENEHEEGHSDDGEAADEHEDESDVEHADEHDEIDTDDEPADDQQDENDEEDEADDKASQEVDQDEEEDDEIQDKSEEANASNEVEESEQISREVDDDNDDDDEDAEQLNLSFNDDDLEEEENLIGSIEDNFSKENLAEDDNKSAPLEEIDSIEEEERLVDNAEIEEEHLAAKRAEKLAQEKEDTGNVGMRVGVGLALILVAYCVLARKWRNASDDGIVVSDRRMTLIPDESDQAEEQLSEEEIVEEHIEEQEVNETEIEVKKEQEKLTQKINKYVEDDEEEEEIIPAKKVTTINIEPKPVIIPDDDIVVVDEGEENEEIEVEYEEEIEYDDEVEEIEEDEVKPTKAPDLEEKQEDVQDEEYEDEDVEEEEILEDEEIVEEEEIEEDISDDLDDSELMKKLEEKYGKLPELDDDAEEDEEEKQPVAPARRKPKPVGGNSVEDEFLEWDGDEDNKDWNQELNLAQAEMDEGKLENAYRHFTRLSLTKPKCWRSKYGRAKALDFLAEEKRSNNLLQNAIATYQEVLDMKISNNLYLNVAERMIDRIKFMGKYHEAVPFQSLLIKRFPEEPKHRNNLAILYLMMNKPELARPVLLETLKLWPNDGVALVHQGFLLKTVDNKLEEAIDYLQRGIDTKESGTLDGRFLFHLGEAWSRLGHKDKADEVHKLGADLNIFLSPQQRSLYNVDRLKGKPWWKPEETPYLSFIKKLELHWEKIAKEARQLRSAYKPEQENLKDVGDWSQFELFVRGLENKKHCSKCPFTCQLVKTEPAATGCRRGQIKFSAMTPGTHVYAHVGPTNCRLRAHLGLEGTKDTFIRVVNETRTWEIGKVFMFDDSFEHEVWHNGTELRIVLIVDLWHPELTSEERISLAAI